MEFLKKYKTILIVLVVLVAGFYVYSQFFAGSGDDALLVREESPAAAAVAMICSSCFGDYKTLTFQEISFRTIHFVHWKISL